MFDRLVDLLVQFLHLFRFWAICPAEYQGFVRRFGLPVRDLKPGFNFVWPTIEAATLADMRVWADILQPQSLRTRDGKTLVIRLLVSHQVLDPRAFTLTVYDAGNNLMDLAAGLLGQVVLAHDADAVLSGRVLKALDRKVVLAAKKWGIGVNRVAFVDIAEAPAFRLFGIHQETQ